jgi:hypothetical protein
MKKEKVMPKVNAKTARTAAKPGLEERAAEYLGICTTCNYAANCAHRIRNADVAIWECDNYDDYVPEAEGVNHGAAGIPRAAVQASAGELDVAEYRGLCKNCERRKDCLYPKPEAGVWHCEEYE